MYKDLERARVTETGAGGHVQDAFAFEAVRPHTPEALAQHIGLNWAAAMDLHKRDLLSFDPSKVMELTRTQDAELRFLGRLTVAGCCGSVLVHLLSGLRKPYAYHLDRMYYDWGHRQWRLLEDTEQLEQHFREWLDELVAWGDLRVLQLIQLEVNEAVERLTARQQGAWTRGAAAAS